MDAATSLSAVRQHWLAVPDTILRDCFALEAERLRPPAKARLEEALGPELAHRLVVGLTAGGRAPGR